MFRESREAPMFEWNHLGDVEEGRPNLGRTILEKLEFTLTVAEDLDCSGFPMTNEVVCTYDEGFLAGILEKYTDKPFEVRGVDRWASGGRTCRFHALAK